jgi:hypothetical protein
MMMTFLLLVVLLMVLVKVNAYASGAGDTACGMKAPK